MFVKEIIIDGFKSYAHRVVLDGLDNEFNAITGLNGSGKSNVFDAICFVLGISQLKDVRANEMQDLIFKRGQAGVTRASVTITFDNKDKDRSPQGYHAYDEIIVTRIVSLAKPGKYLLNGKVVPMSTVHKMFHSVQLNVNNPHFLIMQGRITKVINMRPREILGLIAEAAGTNAFDMQKKQAEKTFERKDKKLAEIDNILNQDIIPTMEKLRHDQKEFVEWTKEKERIERLERYSVALHYYTKQKSLDQAQKQLSEIDKEIKRLQAIVSTNEKSLTKHEKKIESQRIEKQSGIEQEFLRVEKEVSELSKVLVQQNNEYEHKREQLKGEQSRSETFLKQVQSDRSELESLKVKTQNANDLLLTYSEHLETCKQKLENAKRQRSNVEAGLAVSSDTTDGKTLTEQLRSLKEKTSNIETELIQSRLKVKHLNKSINEKEASVNKLAKDDSSLQTKLKVEQENLNAFKQRLTSEQFDSDRYHSSKSTLREMHAQLQTLSKELNEMAHVISRFYFNYDRSLFQDGSVLGTVAELFSIKDPERSSVALEVTASGRLYQIVVDNEETAKSLIQTRKEGRITVIPLNKVRTADLPKSIIHKAEKMNAVPALMLIEYDEKVDPAMKYAFGTTMACAGFEDAKRVAYDKDIRCRTVTYEGDSFDPSGTLTGGSRPRGSDSALMKLALVKSKTVEREKLIVSIRQLQASIDQQKSAYEKVKKMRDTISLKEHEISLLQQRMNGTRSAVQLKHIESEKLELEKLTGRITTLSEQKELIEKQVHEVEDQVSQFSSTQQSRADQIKKIDKSIESAKNELNAARNKHNEKYSEYKRLEAQIQVMESDLLDMEKQQKELESNIIHKLQQELTELEETLLSKKQKYDTLSEQVAKYQTEMKHRDNVLSKLMDQKEKLEKANGDLAIELKQLEHKKQRLQATEKESISVLKTLNSQNQWIKSEMHLFGNPKTEYSFDGTKSVAEVHNELGILKNKHNKSSQTINKKVMTMIDSCESNYNDLLSKRKRVDQDKMKIVQTMKDLDDKKHAKLVQTWKKVNTDFGSIFSTLLPGSSAKLEPEYDEDNVLTGLEFRVAFGGVWKQSLSELSGGQRSLLALSLILSLLLFSPAPMYILDEIDSALDVSHTQNIGRMLRMHFSGSQFLLISLKEELFQNANVLFRTKFVDGSSTISRMIGHKSVITDEEVSGVNSNGGSKRGREDSEEDNSPEIKRRRRVK